MDNRVQNYGDGFRQTENYQVRKEVINTTESGQFCTYDGLGNKTIFVDTTAADVMIEFEAAKIGLNLRKTLRVVAGANVLRVKAVSGNVESTATYSVSTAFVTFTSNGTNYFRIG